jgi:hypothetical protein
MTIDPIMHIKQPILPMKLSRSFRKMEERMAVITTDCAGVSCGEYGGDLVGRDGMGTNKSS